MTTSGSRPDDGEYRVARKTPAGEMGPIGPRCVADERGRHVCLSVQRPNVVSSGISTPAVVEDNLVFLTKPAGSGIEHCLCNPQIQNST